MPIISVWRVVLLALALMTVTFGVSRRGWYRLAAAGATVLAVAGVKTLLPRADIAEAHNAFMVLGANEALERGLPPTVFHNWKAQFDALYPPAEPPYPDWSWRAVAAVPNATFTRSSDSFWRPARYTRQVDDVDFGSLAEFRGGFANEMRPYNFWVGEPTRQTMPFYVMYEMTPAVVGSQLAWRGQLFWQRSDNTFEESVHEEFSGRAITSSDVGKRVYAAFFPGREQPFRMQLQPSITLRASAWAESLLIVAAVFSILVLTIQPRWDVLVRGLALFSITYVLLACLMASTEAKYLGTTYLPHRGGDDGLFHDDAGREMAMLAASGQVAAALEGTERVFWFTPGTRYVRMVEKLVFGDTNHLFALLLACIPIPIFYLIGHFLGRRWAWLVIAVFLIIPFGNLSFLQYVANAKLGYGEAVAGGLFMAGLILLLRNQPRWGGAAPNLPLTWAAGTALAASMMIRPNFAIAVVWLGVAYGWAAVKERSPGAFAALALGLGLALWMPFHNIYYGSEFYLISKSGATISVPLAPRDYAQAAVDILSGHLHTAATTATGGQVRGWLSGGAFAHTKTFVPIAWFGHALRLISLIVTCWVAWRSLRGKDVRPGLGVVAVAALCALIPMLFVFATLDRYAMLGWDLSILVMIVWVAHRLDVSHRTKLELLST